jgi:hypothetical protein
MTHYDDCNPPAFYDCKAVTARRRHKCCECLAAIENGEPHERVVGKWEGSVETFRTCSLCVKVRRAMGPEQWPFGCLIDGADERDFPGVVEVVEFRKRRLANWEARREAAK